MRIFNISYEMITQRSFIHKSFIGTLDEERVVSKEELDNRIKKAAIRREGNDPRNVGRIWYSELDRL